MKISSNLKDSAVLAEIGGRIARLRLNRNLSQSEFAREAGVSLPTLQRLENGHSAQAANLIRVLRALGLLENLDLLLPEPPASPIQQIRLAGKTRRRATGKRRKPAQPEKGTDGTWSWGDEE